MKAQVVIIGDNFRFGHKQAGDTATLTALGARLGYRTHPIPAVARRGSTISSSEIRRKIESGDVAAAGRMLGRPDALGGQVISGRGIGAQQTVPTLNLSTSAEILPAEGVYITRTLDLETAACWNSISNI